MKHWLIGLLLLIGPSAFAQQAVPTIEFDSIPNPLRLPPGCRFAPRCDYRWELCAKPPPLFDVGGQQSRCWLCESGKRQQPVRHSTTGSSA